MHHQIPGSNILDAPHSLSLTLVIGFLADYPAIHRGAAGRGKRNALRFRAMAGLADGPTNAAEVEAGRTGRLRAISRA